MKEDDIANIYGALKLIVSFIVLTYYLFKQKKVTDLTTLDLILIAVVLYEFLKT